MSISKAIISTFYGKVAREAIISYLLLPESDDEIAPIAHLLKYIDDNHNVSEKEILAIVLRYGVYLGALMLHMQDPTYVSMQKELVSAYNRRKNEAARPKQYVFHFNSTLCRYICENNVVTLLTDQPPTLELMRALQADIAYRNPGFVTKLTLKSVDPGRLVFTLAFSEARTADEYAVWAESVDDTEAAE